MNPPVCTFFSRFTASAREMNLLCDVAAGAERACFETQLFNSAIAARIDACISSASSSLWYG